MMTRCVALTGFLFSISAWATTTPVEQPWVLIDSDEGIKVYRKEIPGSNLIAFRGEAEIDGSIARIAQVLGDSKRKSEWVSNLVEARTVKVVTLTERVEYNHTAVPWPFQDRDFVYEAKLELNREKGTMIARMKSIEDPGLPENSGKVRGEISESLITLRALDAGKRSWIAVEIHADPKGSVPKWLANLFQKDWPRKTLRGIQRQVAKPDVPEEPNVKAFFDGTLVRPVAASAALQASDSTAVAAPTAAGVSPPIATQ